MNLTRRRFLTLAAAGSAGLLSARFAAAKELGCPIGVCDWSFQEKGPGALSVAKTIGLDGVEISAGSAEDTLEIAKPEVQAAYRQAKLDTGVAIPSIAMGFLNGAPYATEDRAPAWLDQTIAAAKALEVKVILLAFFGKGDLRTKDGLKERELDAAVERLKVAAPVAGEAGVILGLENTLSAKDNMAILERVQHDAVQVYYDIGNSTYNGYDVPAEIKMLGDRLCQVHFKDGRYSLGEGKVEMAPVREALESIDYKDWVVLETAIQKKDRDGSFKKNLAYVRDFLKSA